jgi:hypothetical protein
MTRLTNQSNNNLLWQDMPQGNRLTDMEFDEISLVTRPANQLSKVVLYKSGAEQMSEAEILTDEEIDLEDEFSKGGTATKKGAYKKNRKKNDPESLHNRIVDEDEALDELKMKKGDQEAMVEYIEALESANEELMAKLADSDTEYVEEEVDLLKSADPAIVELIKSAEERAEVAEQIAKNERDHRLNNEFISKAEELDSLAVAPEQFGAVLKSAFEALDQETFDSVMQVLTSANEQVKQGSAFDEIGKSTTFDSDSGIGQVEQAAQALMAEDEAMTKESAIAKAVSDNPTLYDIYLKEGR